MNPFPSFSVWTRLFGHITTDCNNVKKMLGESDRHNLSDISYIEFISFTHT